MLLLSPAALGLLAYGIGALGFTPWLTAYTYYRRARLASELPRQQRLVLNAGAAFAAGAVIAICLPTAVGGVALVPVYRWQGRAIEWPPF